MYKLVMGLTDHGESVQEQTRVMKETGWEGAFSVWNENADNRGTARCIKDAGLYYQSVHAPFLDIYLLWESKEEGQKELERQKRCLRECADFGVDLVVEHAIIGMERNTPTQMGVDRFGELFEFAEKLGITIALENTEGEVYLEKLFEVYGSRKNVKFCIDTGHEMCYNGGADLIGKYADKVVATHLNDNLGQSGEKIVWTDDLHLLPFEGKADWQGVVRRLKKAGYKGDFTFEPETRRIPGRTENERYARISFEEFSADAFSRAKKIKEMFLKAEI